MREIGGELGRDKATVSRELQRNAPEIHKGYYLSHKAQARAQYRWVSSHLRDRLKRQEIRDYVVPCLKDGLSPELIAGRLPIDHPGARVSHEAIYQYVYADRKDLIRYLVRHNKKRKPRGHSRNPPEADTSRIEFPSKPGRPLWRNVNELVIGKRIRLSQEKAKRRYRCWGTDPAGWSL